MTQVLQLKILSVHPGP